MNASVNDTDVMKVYEQLNQHANVREYLLICMNNLSIDTPDDIKFQASILTTLTKTTNQLTRKTAV